MALLGMEIYAESVKIESLENPVKVTTLGEGVSPRLNFDTFG